jgi:hypothetical protein
MKKSTADNKKEERSMKISQEAVGNVRKIMEKIEERRKKEDPYLRVPGPEARHANVPVPRGGSGTWVSSSSSSSGGRTGASQSSIGKFSGDKGALGQGGEFHLNGTLYGGDTCQTDAAHNCAAAVPPISNLGEWKTTNLGSVQNQIMKARNANCGTPRGILETSGTGVEQNGPIDA